MSVRFIVVDWGTSRFRAYIVQDGAIVDRAVSDEGISVLKSGAHQGVFQRHCARWLKAEPDAPVLLVGMVGSREGWVEAPYAICPAGPSDIACALIAVDLGEGRRGHIVPGLCCEPQPGAVDVIRGEETLVLGTGVTDGLVCLAGTHSKWVEMRSGRIERFATYFTGEMYALLRHHSMIGRPATEPEDPSGFALGLEAAERNSGAGGHRVGLLHLIFGARAATVTRHLSPAALGPYISGLLTGDEINSAFSLFPKPEMLTLVGARHRAELLSEALKRHGVQTVFKASEDVLIRGLHTILGHLDRADPASGRTP
jgi:2-dehydro-3-deoxygalactonokinase